MKLLIFILFWVSILLCFRFFIVAFIITKHSKIIFQDLVDSIASLMPENFDDLSDDEREALKLSVMNNDDVVALRSDYFSCKLFLKPHYIISEMMDLTVWTHEQWQQKHLDKDEN